MTNKAEWLAWRNARNRCYNPKSSQYRNYGARGIAMCDKWRTDFCAFLRDVGRRPSHGHSLDRIDYNLGYEPGNCRWATARQQSNNTRANRRVEWRGETKSVTEWATQIGMKPGTLWARLFIQRMSVDRAMTDPMRPGKKSQRVVVS